MKDWKLVAKESVPGSQREPEGRGGVRGGAAGVRKQEAQTPLSSISDEGPRPFYTADSSGLADIAYSPAD